MLNERYGRVYCGERPDVARLVPTSARSILDVGCGAGDLGALIKRLQPEVRIVGVELYQPSAAAARLVLDEVILGGIEETLSQLPSNAFDCIILADVLEHLQDPWHVLRALRRCLRAQGCIVASVPNVRHYYVWIPLILAGQWNYSEWGLLDSTHVRFFTRHTLLEMFSRSGYKPQVVDANYTGNKLILGINWCLHRAFDDFLAGQYLLVATPGDPPDDREDWWRRSGGTPTAWQAIRPHRRGAQGSARPPGASARGALSSQLPGALTAKRVKTTEAGATAASMGK